MINNGEYRQKNFIVSLHTKQMIMNEAKENNTTQRAVCERVLSTFVNMYKLHDMDIEYIRYINVSYLKFIIEKYNGVSKKNYLLTHKSFFSIDDIDEFEVLKRNCPTYSVRMFELACFYYFNIMPAEFRATYK